MKTTLALIVGVQNLVEARKGALDTRRRCPPPRVAPPGQCEMWRQAWPRFQSMPPAPVEMWLLRLADHEDDHAPSSK
jgi:hypothetical protein